MGYLDTLYCAFGIKTQNQPLVLKALAPEPGKSPPRVIIVRLVEEDSEFPIKSFFDALILGENAKWDPKTGPVGPGTRLAFSASQTFIKGLELRLEDTKWEGFGSMKEGKWHWECKELKDNEYRITPSLLFFDRRQRFIERGGKQFPCYYGAVAGDHRYLSIAKTFNFLRHEYYEFAKQREECKQRYGIRLDYVVTTVSLLELLDIFEAVESCRISYDHRLYCKEAPVMELSECIDLDLRLSDKYAINDLRKALLVGGSLKRIRGMTCGRLRSLSRAEQLRFVLSEQSEYLRRNIFAALELSNTRSGHPGAAIDCLNVEFEAIQEALEAYLNNRIDSSVSSKLGWRAHGRNDDGVLDETEDNVVEDAIL